MKKTACVDVVVRHAVCVAAPTAPHPFALVMIDEASEFRYGGFPVDRALVAPARVRLSLDFSMMSQALNSPGFSVGHLNKPLDDNQNQHECVVVGI